MAKDTKNDKTAGDGQGDVDPNARLVTSDEDKAKARKWFARAAELVETRSYDYAITCFVDGLALWPEAVEDAHQPLRGCAAARQHTGGKKPGFAETVKRSMTHKDPLKAMLNAEWLLAHDPMNLNYMEGIFKNANRLHCEDTLMWAGAMYQNAAVQDKKPSAKRFALVKDIYEEAGDRAQDRSDISLAVEAYQRAVEALNHQQRFDPKDMAITNIRRDLSTKLTILKGRYQTAESFTESIRDREEQADLHDKDRMIQSSERLAQLVRKAEHEMAENPGVTAKVIDLVDLLCREDNEAHENQAIGVLVDQFKQHEEYRYKLKADDIRMRQLARAYRRIKASGDLEATRAARIKQLTYEIAVFADRLKQYPTDQRVRYEYGRRLFSARKVDEAIPMFQAARSDGKNRSTCDLYLGRCFYAKGYLRQAIETLARALEAHEIDDDDQGKALCYWLGRAQEADGAAEKAIDTYGQLLQIDYNYRDVRQRMDKMIEPKGSK